MNKGGGDTVALSIKKQYTDNPFIDTLLYCVKVLAYGCILKDEIKANAGETMDSLKNAERYIYAMENGAEYEMYDYSEEMILSVISPADIMQLNKYVKDKNSIPDKYRAKLVQISRQNVIDTYIEQNDYYRTICGLPKYGDRGIPFAPYKYLLPKGEYVEEAYVHEMGADGAKMLELYGIMDVIKADYPEAEYLNYMFAGISVYKARKCIDKQILYMPTSGNLSIDDLFYNKFELVRTYVRRRVDSKAMEYGSENYQGFLSSFIFFLTILDMVVEVQDHIIKKDILDARCIEYIFDMYGVPYYKSIPLKYQITMCKNINALIQYKSSPQDMFNFINYFGANSIEIYKYYLLRDRNTDTWGNYIYNMKTKTESIPNQDSVIHIESSVTDSSKVVPFPFDYYLNKGNVMVVWAGPVDERVRLIEDVDYEIYNYDLIRILNSKYANKQISYEFFYDADTVKSDFIADTKNGVIHTTQVVAPNKNLKNPIKLNLPYEKYLYDGNAILVSIGGEILDDAAYTVNTSNNTLSINTTDYKITNKVIYISYFYGPTITTRYKKTVVTSSDNGTNTFKVPEPFTNYILNGNGYFVTMGSTFISEERYEYNESTRSIKFIDDSTLNKNRTITFHFIYSIKSIYSTLNITSNSQTIKASEYYQYIFIIYIPPQVWWYILCC